MAHRPTLLMFVVATVLTACSYFGVDIAKIEQSTALPPADVPGYRLGDRYTYDNPNESWTVAGIASDLVHWESSLGNNQVTAFDPLLPPIEWTIGDNPQATRKFLEWSGSLFPLEAGREMTYTAIVDRREDTAPAHFAWRCDVGQPRHIRVPAGRFATYPVLCRRHDGYRIQGYYAPAIQKAVSITYIEPTGQTVVRSLQSFALGKGQVIAAKKPAALPPGWSNTLVAGSEMRAVTARRDRKPMPLPPPADRRFGARTASGPSQAGRSPKPAAAAGGRYRVQLSSLPSAASAHKEWKRLQSAFPELLRGRELVLERREITGRGTFYRVQTGQYDTLQQARAVCDTLKKRKQGCLAIKR